MANLAREAVALYPAFNQGGQSLAEYWIGGVQARSRLVRSLLLTLTGQGSGGNQITAAVLGYSKLTSCSNAIDLDNGTIYTAVVDVVSNRIYLTTGTTPEDVTGPVQLTVIGIPL